MDIWADPNGHDEVVIAKGGNRVMLRKSEVPAAIRKLSRILEGSEPTWPSLEEMMRLPGSVMVARADKGLCVWNGFPAPQRHPDPTIRESVMCDCQACKSSTLESSA